MSRPRRAKQNSVWLKLASTRLAIDRDSLMRVPLVRHQVAARSARAFIAPAAAQRRAVGRDGPPSSSSSTPGGGLLAGDEFVKFNRDTGASLSDFDFGAAGKSWTKLAKARVRRTRRRRRARRGSMLMKGASCEHERFRSSLQLRRPAIVN